MLKRGLEPSHPGEILKGLYPEPLGLTQEAAAKNLSKIKVFQMPKGRQNKAEVLKKYAPVR